MDELNKAEDLLKKQIIKMNIKYSLDKNKSYLKYIKEKEIMVFINNTNDIYKTSLNNINKVKRKYMKFDDDKIINNIIKKREYANYIISLIYNKETVYMELCKYVSIDFITKRNIDEIKDITEIRRIKRTKYITDIKIIKDMNEEIEKNRISSNILKLYIEQTDEMIIDIIKEIDKELPPPYNADNKQKVNFHDAKHDLHIENEKIEF